MINQAGEKMEMFRNRLIKVNRHLSKQARRLGISCFRVYDHDLPEFPFCIERYGEYLYVAEYKRRHGLTDEEHDRWLTDCRTVLAGVFGLPVDHIFLKTRQRKEGRRGQYQKTGDTGSEFQVEEGGLKFIVNLHDYLDTGLFLDHRVTRGMVRGESAGKNVLNLFAYTGSFSVYAAVGGADSVTTVDMSRTYLGWAERNMQLNGFTDTEKYSFIQADVVKLLAELPPDHYDLVIMDPPSFSNSKRMDDFLDVQRDHANLINQCLETMKPNAVLYFSTNLTQFTLDARRLNSSRVSDITKATTPFDFEGKLFRYCFRIEK